MRIIILGIGNELMSDDGFGVHVVREMEKMELPEHVELIDGGTLGPTALYGTGNADLLIAIDTVNGGCEPGSIFKFTPEDIDEQPEIPFSLHDVSFLSSLQIAEMTGDKPENVVIIAIEPANLDTGTTLSEPVSAKINEIIELTLKEIEAFTDENC